MVNTMEGPLAELLITNSKDKISAYFTRIIQDERLYALGFCDLENRLLHETQAYPQDVTCRDTLNLAPNSSTLRSFSSGPLHIMSASIESNGRRLGRLLLLHDMRLFRWSPCWSHTSAGRSGSLGFEPWSRGKDC
jgi:trehalose 6-phosphate synthase